MFHPLLQRMLKRAGLSEGELPSDLAAWNSLLDRLSRAQTEADQDRDLLERSLALSGAEIQESEQRYRATFSRAPIGIAHEAADGAFRLVNDRLCDITGYTREELMRMRVTDITHAEDRQTDREHTSQLFVGATPLIQLQQRYVRKDGSPVWVRVTRSLMQGRDTDSTYAISVIEDFTELRLAEEMRTGQNQILEMTAMSVPLEIVLDRLATLVEGQLTDTRCAVMLADSFGERLLTIAAPTLPREYNDRLSSGVPIGPCEGSCGTAAFRRSRVIVEDITTDPLWEAYRGLALPHGLRACWSEPIISRDQRVLGTFAIYYRQPRRPVGGEHLVIESAAHLARVAIERRQAEAAMRRHTDDLVAAKAVLEDQAMELAARAGELQYARDAAEAASRAKSDFLANMSHEIRTPLTAILGYTDLVATAEAAPAERAEWVQTIRRNGEHLLAVLNDILDLSKIEAGKIALEQIPSSPIDLVTQCVSLLRTQATNKGLAFDAEFAGPLPRAIHTDPTRLRQILVNLVGNAIKFTEHGSVRLKTRFVAGIPDRPPTIAFEVIDTGIGMSAEQAATLFQPFTQADETMTRRFGGTGLGLTISQRLANLLGGDIRLASTPGQGSTFTVELVLRPSDAADLIAPPSEGAAAPAPPPASVSGRLTGIRILLAEDGLDNQRLISFHLRKAGAEVTLAENGRIALEHAQAAMRSGSDFDLILMDMQMPELDGYGATAALRKAGYHRPIVALTAHAMSGDRERCIEAGCDDFASKPIDRAALIDISETWGRARVSLRRAA